MRLGFRSASGNVACERFQPDIFGEVVGLSVGAEAFCGIAGRRADC
jgi:hypothetical protein